MFRSALSAWLASKFELPEEREFEAGGQKVLAGSWILADQDPVATQLSASEELINQLQVSTQPDVPLHVAKAPRIGVSGAMGRY